MLRSLALALVATGLLVPANASASTASSDGTTLTLVGGAELNEISFPTTSFGDVAVEDLAGITAGSGCVQREATVVTCSFTKIVANLGDGDDRWNDSGVTEATIDGGRGNDRILAGQLDDVLIGGEGDDELDGDSENDTLLGGPGNDTLFGDDAADSLDGGPGTDRLNGDGPTGVNTGNDVLKADDGEQDLVDCNFGADSATVDAIDTTANCESVTVVNGGGDPDPDPEPTGTPRVTASVPSRVGRAKFAAKGVAGRFTVSQAGSVTITLALSAQQARKAGLGAKAVKLAVLKGQLESGAAEFRAVPAKRFRSALGKAGAFKAKVTFVLTTNSGTARATKTVSVQS